MSGGRYVFDQGWQQEHKRLAGMEQLWDAGTRAVIESLGIAPRWRCLEVGAGRGSIARWLADKAADGQVVATDISTRHLNEIGGANLEVRKHNILNDPLPEGHFDLVHARLLPVHLTRRALPLMRAALRAGGWLVVEQSDWEGPHVHPDDKLIRRVIDAVLRFMSRSGFDPRHGRKLFGELEDAGLEDVGADGRLRVYRGGSPGSAFARLSLESLSAALVESGDLAREEITFALDKLDDPSAVFLSPTMIAAWGRKPD